MNSFNAPDETTDTKNYCHVSISDVEYVGRQPTRVMFQGFSRTVQYAVTLKDGTLLLRIPINDGIMLARWVIVDQRVPRPEPIVEERKLPVILPADSAARKEIPIVGGVLDYFPNAIAYVAGISKAGNDKHNAGQPLHWSVNKSTDHAECIARHLLDRGTIDPTDGKRHSGMLAWRALANLEEELVAAGAPRGRGAYES